MNKKMNKKALVGTTSVTKIKSKQNYRIAILLCLTFIFSSEAHAVSGLCGAKEVTVFSCNHLRKTASICASYRSSGKLNYIQYRFGKNHPEISIPKISAFNLKLINGEIFNGAHNGAEELTIHNREYSYQVSTSWDGSQKDAQIRVMKRSYKEYKTLSYFSCSPTTKLVMDDSGLRGLITNNKIQPGDENGWPELPATGYTLNNCQSPHSMKSKQTSPPAYAFTSNFKSNNVSAYRIDATTGALSPVGGSPFKAGLNPNSVTVNPTGTLAFVANAGGSNISVYKINGCTGSLTEVSGSPFAARGNPNSVAVNPSGTLALVTNGSFQDLPSSISVYRINSNTGMLTEVQGSPFSTSWYPQSVTINPSGTMAFVTAGSKNLVYSIDASTGALTPVAGSPFPASGFASSVTFNPSGTMAFVANAGTIKGLASSGNSVSVYHVDAITGAITEVHGSPFRAGEGNTSVAVNPAGTLAFAANFDGNTISVYNINQATESFTPVSVRPFSAGWHPESIKINRDGTLAFVANANSNNVSAYRISITGALTEIPGSPFDAGKAPTSVAIAQP